MNKNTSISNSKDTLINNDSEKIILYSKFTKSSNKAKSSNKNKKIRRNIQNSNSFRCQCGAILICRLIKNNEKTNEPVFRYVCSLSNKARFNCRK